MIDNSIITKFELSQREKTLKAKFFGKKKDSLPGKDNSIQRQQINHPEITDEAVNKMIEENFKESDLNNRKQTGNINQSGGSNPQQMNIIYTQNRLMERNMDILQETQRSLHDLLLYNMRKDGGNQQHSTATKTQGLDQGKINGILSPIYSSIDAIKSEIHQITAVNSVNAANQYSYPSTDPFLNMKSNDMVSMNANLKNNQEAKMKYSMDLIEQNKKTSQNSTVLKAIGELKTTLTSMNKEMSTMENVFQDKLSKVIQDNQKNQLNALANMSSIAKGRDGKKQEINVSAKHLDIIDYSEYKNDLLDINLQKEALISEFKNNAPVLKPLVKPKEKIVFNYNVDYSTANESFTSNELNKSKGNVFNQNWNSSQCLKQHKKKKQHQQQQQQQQLNEFNSKQIQSTSVGSSINNQRVSQMEYEDYQIKQSRMNQQQQQQQQMFNNQTSNYNNNMISLSQNNNTLSIADKMQKYQERMNEMKSKLQMTSTKDHQPKEQLVIEQGPSNEELIARNEPSGGRSVKAYQFMQKTPTEPVVKVIEPQKKIPFNVGLFPVDYVPSMSLSRDDMTMVQVGPKEKDRRILIEDVVLRLCLDKIVKDKPMQTINRPIPINPYKINDEDMRNLTTNMIEDYIRLIFSNKKKKEPEPEKKVEVNLQIIPPKKEEEVKEREKEPIVIQPQDSNKEVRVIEREIIHHNQKDDSQIEALMKLLIEKFGGIESALNKIKIPINNQERPINPNLAREITDKIKSDMKININLKGVHERNQRTQRQPQRNNANANTNAHYSYGHSSFLVKGKDLPKEQKDKEASHLFESTQKIEMNALDELIQQPHMINLAEYDISSVSSYVSESKALDNQNKTKQELNDTSNSLSKGQILTDQSQSQNQEDSVINSKKNTKTKTGLDLLLLGNFNENIPIQAINFTHEKDDELYYQDEGISRIDHNEDNEDESLILMNKKEMVGLDNNNRLKQMHLFESNEYKDFKRNYPDTYSSGNMRQQQQPMLMSFGTTGIKPTDQQYRTNQFTQENIANASIGANAVKLTKISNEEIAGISQKENQINEKLKHLVNITNNTISENSDITQQQNTFEERTNNEPFKKSYKTDQSSSMNE